MQNELCVKCDGRGFKAYARGQILAHKDLAVKANLYKLERCDCCGGNGVVSSGLGFFGFVCWISLGLIAAYVFFA